MPPPSRFDEPYAVVVRGARYVVRVAEADEPGTFTLVLGDTLVPIDHPADLLAAVGDGSPVTADFGRFSLVLRRGDDGRPRYQGVAGDAVGPEDADEERALWGLLAVLGDEASPRACFFCRWSEIEPSTGWGNLGCAVEHAAAYDEVATSPDPRTRKWRSQGMLSWVDEWQGCERFEVRPHGYGYRGRPAIKAPGT